MVNQRVRVLGIWWIRSRSRTLCGSTNCSRKVANSKDFVNLVFHVRIRLKKLGFPSRSTRIGTWQTITQATPPPVLADALGLNPQTAIRHARRGSGQYGAYVADRIHADM